MFGNDNDKGEIIHNDHIHNTNLSTEMFPIYYGKNIKAPSHQREDDEATTILISFRIPFVFYFHPY